MKRFERIIALFVKLQTSQFVTAKSVGTEFGVSERTIYRDIRAMEAAGIPIYSEAGKGFQLMEGFRIPPTSFSENEINALITAELLVSKNPDSSLIKSYREALDKIRAIIRYQEQEKASLLDNRLTLSTNKLEQNTEWLSKIQSSITNQKVIKITYRSISKGELTNRDIEPLGVYLTPIAWVLVAYCRLRQANREFRLDHIQSLKVLSERFEARAFDLQNYFQS
jgi:predicted DNA-binding transcriptional regulator YafY